MGVLSRSLALVLLVGTVLCDPIVTPAAPSQAVVAADVAAGETPAEAAAATPAAKEEAAVTNVVQTAENVAAAIAPAAVAGAAAAEPAVTPMPSFDPTAVAAEPIGEPAVSSAMNAAMKGDKAQLAAMAPAAIAQAPAASADFVTGFISGYFAKVTLETGEKLCIQKNIHGMTQDSVGLVTEIAQVIGQLVAKQAPNAVMMMSGAGQVVELVTTTQTLIKGCVQKDAIAVMNETLKHLKNPQYVQGRLLANGIDIANVTADAIPAWQSANFVKVGYDFGTLLRKILLSRNTGPVQMVLPEGMDKTQVYSSVVNGVIEGLFVAGTSVTITDSANTNVHIFVDLHKCIAEEAPYFTTAINALYLAIAQVTTNIEQWQLRQKGIQTGYVASGGTTIGDASKDPAAGGASPQVGVNGGGMAMNSMNWMNQLSGLMTNIPTLMDRCGLTEEQRKMMAEAIKNMNDVGMAFNIPGPSDRIAAGNAAATKFESATAAWKVGKYEEFGTLLGGLMRDLLLTIYPQKYHVGDGKLRSYVDSKEETLVEDISKSSSASLAVMIGGFCAFMLVGLSLFRVSSRSAALLQVDNDMEGQAADAVE